MTKDVKISIVGEQKGIDGEDRVEINCIGRFYKKNEKSYILYDEIQKDSQSIDKNRIKITGNQVEIMKSGGSSIHMVFDTSKEWITNYNTPYGSIEVGVLTKDVCFLEAEDYVEVRVEYKLEMNGSPLYDCVTTIRAVSIE